MLQSAHRIQRENQAGAILIGVMMLGLVLTLGVGASILLASHASSKVDESARDTQVYYAADGGLKMGIAWVSVGGLPTNSTSFTATINGYTVGISIAPNGWIQSTPQVAAPTSSNPLVLSHIARCSVTVASTVNLMKCTQTPSALTYP